MEQKHFLFITNNNDYLPAKSLPQQFFEGLIKGFTVQAELKFNFNQTQSVTGRIIKVKKNKLAKVLEKYKPDLIGVEGINSWQYIYSEEDFFAPAVFSPGINLNLAVILHNYRRVANAADGKKPIIALHNIENDYGKLLAGIFSAILGDIVLVGKDTEILKKMAKEFFNEYGVMTLTASEPYTKNKCLKVDAMSLLSHVAKMNYVGEYQLSEGKETCSSVFSAPLVETFLIAANVINLKNYCPPIVNLKNVLAVAKVAKKAGFFPLFSTTQM